MECCPFFNKISQIKHFIIFSLLCLLFLGIYRINASDFEWSEPLNIREINSSEDDFAPQWNKFENRLYFSSLRKGKSKFYVSNFVTNGFSLPSELKDPINRATGNVSYISFLSETEAILNTYRKGYRQAYLNLFYSLRRGGIWQKPFPLDSLECECFVLHPTVSPDGSFIIFSSNKDGINKDLDLFIAYRLENGTWGNQERIDELNTDGDEITPFLLSNDTLYFASNGYGGPGGFDIFFSVRKGNSWSKPYPLNSINTRYNESDFVILNDTIALFVSDRPDGVGKMDIYSAKRIKITDTTSKIVQKFEIGLSVQVPFVLVETEFSYDYAQFPSNVQATRVKEINLNFDENDILTYDDVFENVISLFFARWKKQQTIVTIAFDTNDTRLRNILMNTVTLLSREFPNVNEKIKFSNSKDGNLHFFCEVINFFKPIKILNKTFSFDPPVLEVSAFARPLELIKKWELRLRYTNIFRKGDSIPDLIRIDLSKETKFNNFPSDTLFIDFVVYDSNSIKNQTNYPILINNSKVILRRNYNFKGKVYERVYLSDISDKNSPSLVALINEISEYRDYINGIEILTKQNDLLSKIDELVNLLSERLFLNKSKILTQVNVEEYEKFFGEIPENTIIILIERK